jgi:3-deoxy-7-phosphoheptulonate synthase
VVNSFIIRGMIENINIKSLKPLITPKVLMEETPLSSEAACTVKMARQMARNIIQGKDDRLLVVVGPCSIHDRKAAVEFGRLLKEAAIEFQGELCIMMRTYFEKPRTSIGWKGLINDPSLNGSFNMKRGLKLARKILLDLNNLGIPTATEFLDTIIPQYIGDLVSWGAIGARTTESQIHRELVSGLSMPVGFKNGTDGNVAIAIDAVCAASLPHHFLSVTKNGVAAIVSTKGNDACHVILRGANKETNFDRASIKKVVALLLKNKLQPSVMVDCGHGNSQKNHRNQLIVAENVCQQISGGSRSIGGVMLESHLTSGKQTFDVSVKPKWNQSITDACISWEETKPILKNLADAVKSRRAGQ